MGQLSKLTEAFLRLMEKVEPAGFLSCDILFSVRHTKGLSDYSLYALHGCFSKDLGDNKIKSLDSVDILENESIKLFRISYDLLSMKELISNIQSKILILPKLPIGHNQIKHELNLNDIRDLIYSSPDQREASTLSFLPHPADGLTILELVTDKKDILNGITAKDINKIDAMFSKHAKFSTTSNPSRIGNILLCAALDPWRISFRGDIDGKGIRIMLVPMRESLDVNDFFLTITSKEFDEFSGTHIVYPMKKSIYVSGIVQYGDIDIRLWDMKTKSLCGRNQGRIFGGAGSVFSSMLNQKQRIAILRDNQGNTIRKEVIKFSSMERKRDHKVSWSHLVQKEIDDAKKKKLLEQRKLIQFHNGMHLKAIEEIIQIINSQRDVSQIKIWDPYVDDYYLDFLTFIEHDCQIKVLSELKAPTNKDDEPKGFRRLIKALEGVIMDYAEEKRWKKVLAPISRKISKLRIERSELKNQKNRIKWKGYFEELRGKNLKLEFRYKGNGLGEGFHDRFLIIGSKCWALGSSLNHIGSQHCIVMQVEYPELIGQAFDKLWNEVEGNQL